MLLFLEGLIFRTEHSILVSLLPQSIGSSSWPPASPKQPGMACGFMSLAAAEHLVWPVHGSFVGTKKQGGGGEREEGRQ